MLAGFVEMRTSNGGIVIGIDEAGRGPIIGPMVIALVAIGEQVLAELFELGVRDSKELSPRKRRALKDIILDKSNLVIYVIIPPNIIDRFNLNTLEYETIEYMLSRAYTLLGILPSKIIIDAIGPINNMRNYLYRRLQWIKRVPLIIEPKADAKHVAVSAASIVAKVIRDAEIEKLRKLYGVKGSGYPTDTATLEWIIEAYRRDPKNPPWFIRRTWSTLKHIAPSWYMEKNASLQHSRVKQTTLLDYIKKGKESG